ncbi:hypothetical protein ACN27E_23620 [Mycobacterium sp. WMMD1722]|uniref:hypothetical protein n=1 Tax=Mycobacterium sp. WMMD1722 TaxID=3404117 RepID=UPI003BF4A6E6
MTYLDNDATPSVWSIPPSTTREGEDREPSIMAQPFGPDTEAVFEEGFDMSTLPPPEKGSVSLNLSIAEAEELARRLVIVVQAAKQGTYSNMGEELQRFTREKRLNEAWQALMDDIPDD